MSTKRTFQRQQSRGRQARRSPPGLVSNAIACGSDIVDGIRQHLLFPEEHRIARPPRSSPTPMTGEPEPPLPPPESPELDQMCAEVGTCLWYLKTKHFKRDWENQDGGDDDPRTRRALGRLTKGIDALKKAGIKVEDPTNSRYRSGSENLMRPIQFQPTAGLTYEKVTETVSPIIYRSDRLIQRGEVFVAVPEQAPSGPEKPGPTSSAPSPSDPSKAGTQPVAGPSSGPQVDPQPKPGRSAGNATPRGKNATQPDVRHTDGPVEPDANNK